ncbi:MAG: hypothetical protein HYX75_24655 [Acidobacteria bacterium]|nr:hypothetical protein [Acidobacteriota bacterium]
MNRHAAGARGCWVPPFRCLVAGITGTSVRVALVLNCSVAAEARTLTSILDPQVYRSPSGVAVLSVDPSEKDGRGPATYRMLRDGKERWAGKRPFTLFDAVVTDEGVAAGYAYTEGLQGYRDPGKIRIVILTPDGSTRMEELVDRPLIPIDLPPHPCVLGLILVPVSDHFIVRLTHDVTAGEVWRIYNLSTGHLAKKVLLSELSPGGSLLDDLLDARSVPGTPLIITHCLLYEASTQSSGARFALVDPLGGVIWSIDRPHDYDVPGNATAESRLISTVRRTGAILSTGQLGKFELRFASVSERVTYNASLQKETGHWIVEEIRRLPYADDPDYDAIRVMTPERPLKRIGGFSLAGKADTVSTPIRDICAFDFDDEGRIGFVRAEKDGSHSFVIADQQGRVIRTSRLESPTETHEVFCAWAGDSRWVVSYGSYRRDSKASTWWVDGESGMSTAAGDLDCPPFNAIAGDGHGGFVAIVTREERDAVASFTADEEILSFGKDGTRRWSLSARSTQNRRATEGGPSTESYLLSPKDLTVTATGEIAVLDVIMHNIQFYDSDGGHVRTIDLGSAWGREPSYPTDIAADADGGVTVHDFEGPKPLVRMRADGGVQSEIQPSYTNGRPIALSAGFNISPDDRIWVSDGRTIMRLSDEGIVDKILGEPPASPLLGSIAQVVADRSGRLYALDSETGVVHVFDHSGLPLRTCEPAAADLPGKLSWASLAVSDEGHVYLNSEKHSRDRYMHFDSNGKRRDDWRFQGDESRRELIGSIGNDRLLMLAYDKIYIVDGSGKAIRTIEKQPDGRWLGHLQSASVAPDGSFAVLVHHGDSLEVDSCAVNIYTAAGAPIRTVNIERAFAYSSLLFGGNLALVSNNGDLWFLDSTGRPVEWFATGSGTQRRISVFLRGRELAVVWHDIGEVQLFALPPFH